MQGHGDIGIGIVLGHKQFMHIGSRIGRVMVTGYIGQHQSRWKSVPISTASIDEDIAGCNHWNIEFPAGLQFPLPCYVIVRGKVREDSVDHGCRIVYWRKGSRNLPVIGIILRKNLADA